MSGAQPSPVIMADDDDPEMQRAYEQARGSFRYFWREIAWDRRRIVPALEMATVKAPFTDDASRPGNGDAPGVEYMWLFHVDFDGEFVSGDLVNEPNRLTSVKAGDAVRVPLDRISDWMYVMNGVAYGAFTVNALRSRMGAGERREHDEAWGLDFGDPRNVRMDTSDPHPMSETMAPSLEEWLANDPSLVSLKGDNGWTLLHKEAAAGNAAAVQVLLDAGADPGAVSDNGLTPLQLANVLGWESVARLLHGGQSGSPPPPRTSLAFDGVNQRAEVGPPARKRLWRRFWG
jgi:uncharacterized protein YegJ (DUF2314 family)